MPSTEVAAIGRALRVLETLAAEPMTVSELSRRLVIDRSTLYRVLATMEGIGYVRRGNPGHRYEVSPAKIVSLYGLVEERVELLRIARPILTGLRDLTNETVNLGVLADDEVVVIAKEQSHATLSASVGLGRRIGVHSTSLGKALAAFLPDQRLADILSRKGQVAHTQRTITSPEGLRSHLERVRQVGYAVDDEESEYEVCCVAAPVRTHSGQVVASLGIIGPSTRVTLSRVRELSVLVMDSARRLSVATGWGPRDGGTARCLTTTIG